VVSWVRRAVQPDASRPPLAGTDGQDPDDRPDALKAKIAFHIREINRVSGSLPAAAVVHARLLTDTLAEIVAISDNRPLDVYTTMAVRNTLEDYLPTTIRRYLAVPEEQRGVPRQSGVTPTESLHDQVESLLLSSLNVQEAAHSSDADALLAQGAFLSTKFSRSDLDL
jgi:hypothetical protein